VTDMYTFHQNECVVGCGRVKVRLVT